MQSSKIQLINEGDRNTSFFHGVTSIKKNNNFITSLYSPKGIWTSDLKGIHDVIVLHLYNIFKKELTQNFTWHQIQN